MSYLEKFKFSKVQIRTTSGETLEGQLIDGGSDFLTVSKGNDTYIIMLDNVEWVKVK